MLTAKESVNTFKNLNKNSSEAIPEDTTNNEVIGTYSDNNQNVYSSNNEPISSMIKLSNFTKQINYNDLLFTFNQFKLASQGIHIPICYDNQSKLFNIGHCYNIVFVEFVDEEEASKAYNNKILRNKLRFFYGDDLNVEYVHRNELIQLLLPTYFCRYSESLQQNIDYESLIPDNENVLFIEYNEMETLTNICQSPDLYLNFKSEERPYNFVISLCKHYPWCKSNKNNNNKIFNFYKNILLILNQHIEEKKFSNKLNKVLLAKMVKVGVECPGFTNTQKRAIIKKYDNVDNYKEIMIKKDPTDLSKKKLSDQTNTTTTPVNTMDETSNNNINNDSCGNNQTEDECKNNEFNFTKNSFNQENGLAIELSADTEVTDNEEDNNNNNNNNNNSNELNADKLETNNENCQNFSDPRGNQILDLINKNLSNYPGYGFAIQPIPPPTVNEYYNMYRNYDGYNYYGYGNYDYNNNYSREKTENNMKYENDINDNHNNNNNNSNSKTNNNNNKFNPKSTPLYKKDKLDVNDLNNKFKSNEKGNRSKVKNYPDVPIQLARSMVNKTPDCNELFREYCGILENWYRQRLSREIETRVEQKLKDMKYNRTHSDKIISLLENLQMDSLFDTEEDIETKLFKLVAEILRLQVGIERTYNDYKSNSVDNFKNQICKLTENISNIYQIMNIEKSQKELVNLSNQLNTINKFVKYPSARDKYSDSNTNAENFQNILLNAFNCNGNSINDSNIRKFCAKRMYNSNSNDNASVSSYTSSNNNDKDRKGRNSFNMNHHHHNNKRSPFSNNSNNNSNNNINRNFMSRDNSIDLFKNNKNLTKVLMENLSYNSQNQNQNNYYSAKNTKIRSNTNGSNIVKNQDKMNQKLGRQTSFGNMVKNNSHLNKNFSACSSNDTIIQDNTQLLYNSNDTLINNEEISNTSNDNTVLSHCESIESCTSKETYVNCQEKIDTSTTTTSSSKTTTNSNHKEPVVESSTNNMIKGIVINNIETNEVTNDN
ncbi:hypothetical protein BCR36DRAFT_356825 [Piromyces finnis]|uniref:Uncharacterized protein n=1 Tax=Piromyces finnis TaxID=1754191 RepID=A0A1Y1V400_9FUNG|nr:hypothetical protein BCR36DRAFT_356825 [Piromyces finnis]|eukprot:ORX46693.1 hypothetical protein BCR36DRAFT_356825 [Piromyces finnis]